jgi:hypothetical protein
MDPKPSFPPKLRRFFNALAFSFLLLTFFARLASFFSLSLGINQPQLNRAAFWLVVFTVLINWRQIVAFLVYLFPHSKSANKFLLLTGANLLLVLIFLVGYAIFQYGSPLVYESHPKSFKAAKEVPLVENTLISQEFTADSNNLGTVGVKLSVQEKILGFDEEGEVIEIKPERETEEEVVSEESQEEQTTNQNDFAEEEKESLEEIVYYEPAEIIFRLKEKGAENWFYESPYFFEQATPSHLFPFGFPIIEDSEGKTYLVEIEGRGEPNGKTPSLYVFAAADSAGRPYLYSRYVYRQENLKKDWQPILKNTLAKIGLIFKKGNFLFAFFFLFLFGEVNIFFWAQKDKAGFLKAAEKEFSLFLILYLLLAILIQIDKLAGQYTDFKLPDFASLAAINNVFLIAVVVLGSVIALNEKKP